MALAFANGPDLDFLLGLVMGHAGAYHRGVTHTVALAHRLRREAPAAEVPEAS